MLNVEEKAFPALEVGDLAGILEECRRWSQDATFALPRRWKDGQAGRKVAGYFPVYTPVEIVHAAGMLPVAVLGGGSAVDIRRADAVLPSFVCSIPRTTLELALTGKLDFLDAMLFHPICDVARNLAFIWAREFPTQATTLLYLPQNLTSTGTDAYLRTEYERLKALLERVSGNRITEDRLANSVAMYNRQRQLIRDIYGLRKEEPWLLSASEAYSLVRVGTVMAVEEHIALLEEVRALVPARAAKPIDRISVLFEGAFCEQPPFDFIQAVEEICTIVNDDFVIGSRWFTNDIRPDSDALGALAKSYRDLFEYTSVQHDGRRSKEDAFMNRVRQSGAQAVILTSPKFCEPGLDDQVGFAAALDEAKIPYLALEFEEKMTSFDSAEIQVETFAESLLFYD